MPDLYERTGSRLDECLIRTGPYRDKLGARRDSVELEGDQLMTIGLFAVLTLALLAMTVPALPALRPQPAAVTRE